MKRARLHLNNIIEREGITLVALVVTVVVLLILAGITLTFVLGENSVFSKASQAKEKTAIAKAREKLEMVLSSAQIEKHTNKQYNEDEYLDEYITSRIKEAEIIGDSATVDGYTFELDRSVPKIGEYVGKKKDLIFPVVTVAEVTQADQTDNYRTAKIEITATIDEKAKNGINRIEIWQNGVKLSAITCNNEKTVTTEYKANKNGVYTIKAYADISGSVKTTVEGIINIIEFIPDGSTEWKKSHTTKIQVRETAETVTDMKYIWKKSDEGKPQESEFIENCANNSSIMGQGNNMTGKYYLWVLITIGTGTNRRTYISRSKEFYFDNEGPTVTLTSKPVSETSFKLTAKANDTYNKITKYEFYVEEQLIKMIQEEQVSTEIMVNVDKMEYYPTSVVVWDAAGNRSTQNLRARTKLYAWAVSEVVEKKIPTGEKFWKTEVESVADSRASRTRSRPTWNRDEVCR